MNNQDEEATCFQNETNVAQQSESPKQPVAQSLTKKNAENMPKKSAVNGNLWKRGAAGAGAGLLIGGILSLVSETKAQDRPLIQQDDSDGDAGENQQDDALTQMIDAEVAVADSVNDDMTFGEAFETARAEVGAGGVFEWHGQIYATYTIDEWNVLSDEEKADFSGHFNWNHINHHDSIVAEYASELQEMPEAEVQTELIGQLETSAVEQELVDDDGIEVISVDPGTIVTSASSPESTADVSVSTSQGVDDVDIQVLSIAHDEDVDVNVAVVSIDGQDVALIDADNDQTFDQLAYDADGDGQVEIFDIQNQNLTLDMINGLSDTGNSWANTDDLDYSIESEHA
jgi:hypothetical protein